MKTLKQVINEVSVAKAKRYLTKSNIDRLKQSFQSATGDVDAKRKLQNRTKGIKAANKMVIRAKAMSGELDRPIARKSIRRLGVIPATVLTLGVIAHGVEHPISVKDLTKRGLAKNISDYGSSLGDAATHPNYYRSKMMINKANQSKDNPVEYEKAMKQAQEYRKIANEKE